MTKSDVQPTVASPARGRMIHGVITEGKNAG